jgi:hypothetical protein
LSQSDIEVGTEIQTNENTKKYDQRNLDEFHPSSK